MHRLGPGSDIGPNERFRRFAGTAAAVAGKRSARPVARFPRRHGVLARPSGPSRGSPSRYGVPSSPTLRRYTSTTRSSESVR